MPEETKNKVSSYETPNNAIAYASDIPWVNQTNQRAQLHKKGYPLSKEPRNVPIQTKDHYANPEGMSDHRRGRL